MFIRFANECLLNLKTKEEQAQAIIWYHFRKTGINEMEIQEINTYFEKASLPKMNVTRAKTAFSKSRNICKGSRATTYKLTLSAVNTLDATYGYLWESEVPASDAAGIYGTPYLIEDEVKQAQKMGELYVILNCYENSVRKLIMQVLTNKLGDSWWDVAANTAQKSKVKSRRELEKKHSWLTPRGGSSLFYLDWSDLLSLMRKYEEDFLPYIKDIKFVELRFEELERVRNIVAHNGFLPNSDDFQRVILSFRDWCHQIKK